MKKTIAALTFAVLTVTAFAQNEKYVKAMEPKVAALDTSRNPAALMDLANAFERIALAEKTQWLPYYYAALANVNASYSTMGANMGQADASAVDPVADKAEALLNQAEALSKDNAEIFVVRKMIATLRMMVNPQERYMTYGPQAAAALATAKSLNPENPRIYLLEGQDKFYTPEQFGGSKEEARKLFETAMKKYEAFKPESSIHPAWGKNITRYFTGLANQ